MDPKDVAQSIASLATTLDMMEKDVIELEGTMYVLSVKIRPFQMMAEKAMADEAAAYPDEGDDSDSDPSLKRIKGEESAGGDSGRKGKWWTDNEKNIIAVYMDHREVRNVGRKGGRKIKRLAELLEQHMSLDGRSLSAIRSVAARLQNLREKDRYKFSDMQRQGNEVIRAMLHDQRAARDQETPKKRGWEQHEQRLFEENIAQREAVRRQETQAENFKVKATNFFAGDDANESDSLIVSDE